MGARSLVILDCRFPGRMPDSPSTIAEVLLYTAMVTMRSQAVMDFRRTGKSAARWPRR
jgi:NTE family protein